MPFFPHVDEVVDDHTTQVAQTDLAADFCSSLQVNLVRVFFGIVIHAEVAAVHVDGDQRFRLIDDNRTATLQWNMAMLNPSDFLFDIVLMEQRFTPVVQFDAVNMTRQNDVHELASPLEGARFINPD